MSEAGEAQPLQEAANGSTPARVKAGRHREASLYHALAGAGAGDGRSLEQLRHDALAVYESSELPVWRRSGFWTTSLQSLDLEALTLDSPQERAARGASGAVPEIVSSTLPDGPHAGRIVQCGGEVVHVELVAVWPRRCFGVPRLQVLFLLLWPLPHDQVMAQTLPFNKIVGIKEMFADMDAKNSGCISVDDLQEGLRVKGADLTLHEVQKLLSGINISGSSMVRPPACARVLSFPPLRHMYKIFRCFSFG